MDDVQQLIENHSFFLKFLQVHKWHESFFASVINPRCLSLFNYRIFIFSVYHILKQWSTTRLQCTQYTINLWCKMKYFKGIDLLYLYANSAFEGSFKITTAPRHLGIRLKRHSKEEIVFQNTNDKFFFSVQVLKFLRYLEN